MPNRHPAGPLSRVTVQLGLVLAAAAILSACRKDQSPDQRVTDPTTGIELVLLPAGEFIMGSPEDEAGREPQEAEHGVRLTNPFYLGVTEVTQQQWHAVTGTNPSAFAACGADCPVERALSLARNPSTS